MHFFYLDESGDSGANLNDQQQPIFVLAGLSVADKKWNNTKERIDQIVAEYFGDAVPAGFELHSNELLSPRGEGLFADHDIDCRLNLVRSLLNLIAELGHHVHYFAIDKTNMDAAGCAFPTPYDHKNPYLCAFDYLLTYINWDVKENLGQSARGMIVLDEKKEHHDSVEEIIHHRRYEVPASQKVKWVVEFSYPVDSRKNPMIQLSDLVALCIRRFLEIEHGYKNNVPPVVRAFYAEGFHMIDLRVKGRTLVERTGRNLHHLNSYLAAVDARPGQQWRRQYGLRRAG